MKWLILLLALSQTIALGSEFEEGMKWYEQGKYPEASEKFQASLKQTRSGEIFYDLGNSSFRSQKLGDAIFYYRSALEWLPRDADLKFNLSYARKKWDESKDPKVAGEWVWDYFPFSRTEALGVLGILTVIAFAIATTELLTNLKGLRWCRRGVLAVWLLWGLGTILLVTSTGRFGVVGVPEAKVYSGFGQNNALLFSLSEGTAFTVGEEQGDWVQIRLPDGKKGWLSKADARVSD